MYKTPYRDDYLKNVRDDKGFTYGDDLLGVVQTIIDSLGPGPFSIACTGFGK